MAEWCPLPRQAKPAEPKLQLRIREVTGLLFLSYQKDPKAFIDIQNAFGNVDKMNEYITHIGSGIFACFPGVKDENDYLGKTLFTQN